MINAPVYPLRDLTAKEKEKWPDAIAFEHYPWRHDGPIGRLWTKEQLDRLSIDKEITA